MGVVWGSVAILAQDTTFCEEYQTGSELLFMLRTVLSASDRRRQLSKDRTLEKPTYLSVGALERFQRVAKGVVINITCSDSETFTAKDDDEAKIYAMRIELSADDMTSLKALFGAPVNEKHVWIDSLKRRSEEESCRREGGWLCLRMRTLWASLERLTTMTTTDDNDIKIKVTSQIGGNMSVLLNDTVFLGHVQVGIYSAHQTLRPISLVNVITPQSYS